MRPHWLLTAIALLLLSGELYFWYLCWSAPRPDPYSDGQVAIGIVSLFLFQAGIAVVACVFFIAQALRLAVDRQARTTHARINLLLLIAVPLLLWLSVQR